MDAARVDPVLHGRTGPLIHRYIAGLPDSFTTARPLYRTEDGRVAARFFNCQLTSAFQPIFDFAPGCCHRAPRTIADPRFRRRANPHSMESFCARIDRFDTPESGPLVPHRSRTELFSARAPRPTFVFECRTTVARQRAIAPRCAGRSREGFRKHSRGISSDTASGGDRVSPLGALRPVASGTGSKKLPVTRVSGRGSHQQLG